MTQTILIQVLNFVFFCFKFNLIIKLLSDIIYEQNCLDMEEESENDDLSFTITLKRSHVDQHTHGVVSFLTTIVKKL